MTLLKFNSNTEVYSSFAAIHIHLVITVIYLRLAWVWVRTLKVALHYLIYVARLPKFVKETLLQNNINFFQKNLTSLSIDKLTSCETRLCEIFCFRKRLILNPMIGLSNILNSAKN